MMALRDYPAGTETVTRIVCLRCGWPVFGGACRSNKCPTYLRAGEEWSDRKEGVDYKRQQRTVVFGEWEDT